MSDSLIGKKFGRLTIVAEPQRRHRGKQVAARCCCNVERFYDLKDILDGKARSCGCLAADVSYLLSSVDSQGLPKYSSLKEYRTWSAILQKCNNPRSASFGQNGGRGIKICDAWRYDFPAFFHAVGPAPIGHSLVRVDPAGDFTKDNVRWSASRRGLIFEHLDRKCSVASWAKQLHLPVAELLRELESGKTIGQVDAEFRDEALPVAA